MIWKIRSPEAVFLQTLRANRQRALYVPFISWVPLLAQGAVLLVGARMVTSGELTVGQFVSFNLYLAMLVTPLRSLGMWIGQSQRATASGERIFQVMDEPEEIAELPDATELPPGDGDLRFENVSFEYLEGRPVLLIHNGHIDRKAIRRMQMTMHELDAALRAEGCCGAEEVRFAVLENNGHITVVPKHKNSVG